MSLLSLITFLPLIAAILVLLLPKDNAKLIRTVATCAAGITFILSVQMLLQMDRSAVSMQLIEKFPWIPAFNVQYQVGIDGLSAPLIVLTTFLTFLSVLASFGIESRIKEYFFWFLMLETGMLGVFIALDFFLFYIFWEVMLIPMYFLIGIWGGPKKEYAAIKFFLYTLFGSIFMLVAILAIYFHSTPHTFDILYLTQNNAQFTGKFAVIAFLFLFIAFAIKIPVFPFHTWLPLAHVEAPTAVSVILAGVLLKLGTYGLMRIAFPIFPQAALSFAIPMMFLGFINIVYGAGVAMAQHDMKKMVAYSSINHMGYALIGLSAFTVTGFDGALLQMINHGIITGSLFLLIGVLYDRAHTRDLNVFGGLGARMPVYTGFTMLACMASLGLPGLSGFISEFLCFMGAFSSNDGTRLLGVFPLFKLLTGLSVVGVLITAIFFLKLIQKVFTGPLNPKWQDLKDMSFRELCTVVPLGILTIALGIWPGFLLSWIDGTLSHLVNFIHGVK